MSLLGPWIGCQVLLLHVDSIYVDEEKKKTLSLQDFTLGFSR